MVSGVARLLVGVVAHPALGVSWYSWNSPPIMALPPDRPRRRAKPAPVVRALHGGRARAPWCLPALSPFLPVQSHRAPPACCFAIRLAGGLSFMPSRCHASLFIHFKSAITPTPPRAAVRCITNIQRLSHTCHTPSGRQDDARTGKPGGASYQGRTTHSTQRSGLARHCDRKPYAVWQGREQPKGFSAALSRPAISLAGGRDGRRFARALAPARCRRC